MSTRKINVLVLTSSFPRYKNDWWQQAIFNFYKNLDKSKYKVTVIAPSAPGAKTSEIFFGVDVRRFTYFYPPRLQRLTTGEGILYSGKRGLLNKLQILTFISTEILSTFFVLIKGNFDVIHAQWIFPQGLIAVILKFIFRKPVVVTGHGVDVFGLKKINFLKTFILKNSDTCTVNSKATFEAAYKLCPSAKIEIIPPGVDLTMFRKDKLDMSWRKKFGDQPKIILAVGRFIKWKGFEYIIRALPHILPKFPNAKVVLVGSGPEEENLKRLAQKLNLEIGKNVFFLGPTEPDKLSHIYASSDVLVSPSITLSSTGEKEGLGNVILEALASGTPVVASRSGGIVDIIDGHSTGFLFEERNYRELAEKIIYVFSKRQIRERLSKNGLKLVTEKYDWKKISRSLGELYEEILNP